MDRETITYFSAEKIISTNPRCVFKTEIVENSEPTVAVILGIKVKAVNVLNYFKMFSTIYQMRARKYFSKQKISTAWSSFKSLTKL